jgi:hypothetical protein
MSVLNQPTLCNNPQDGTVQVRDSFFSPASFMGWNSAYYVQPSEPTNKHKYLVLLNTRTLSHALLLTSINEHFPSPLTTALSAQQPI